MKPANEVLQGRDGFGRPTSWTPQDTTGESTICDPPPYVPPPPFSPGYPVAPSFPDFPRFDPSPIAMPPIPVYGFKFCANTCDHCFCEEARDSITHQYILPHLQCCNCGIAKLKAAEEQGWEHGAFSDD